MGLDLCCDTPDVSAATSTKPDQSKRLRHGFVTRSRLLHTAL
jgi:hypothetical protein